MLATVLLATAQNLPLPHVRATLPPTPRTPRLRAHGFENDLKGLRDRNSPTCTLSQNGYGEPFTNPQLHRTLKRSSWELKS